MSPINTLFRALLFVTIVAMLLLVIKNHNKEELKKQLLNLVPKEALKSAPSAVIDFAIQNIPAEKQSKVASLSAELASASANLEPYKQQKIKEIKLMIIDELYKTAVENIKK